MRVTTSGRMCNAVHKPYAEGTKRNGEPWDSPETFTVLLCADYNIPLIRCRVSEAQYAELSNPANFGKLLEVRGDSDREGFMEVLNVVGYQLVDEKPPARVAADA